MEDTNYLQSFSTEIVREIWDKWIFNTNHRKRQVYTLVASRKCGLGKKS